MTYYTWSGIEPNEPQTHRHKFSVSESIFSVPSDTSQSLLRDVLHMVHVIWGQGPYGLNICNIQYFDSFIVGT